MQTKNLPAAAVSALSQVRASLHRLIEVADDIDALEALKTLLFATLPPSAYPQLDEPVRLEDLPPAVRESIEAGLRDSAAGRTRPHEEVWAELKAEFGQS